MLSVARSQSQTLNSVYYLIGATPIKNLGINAVPAMFLQRF